MNLPVKWWNFNIVEFAYKICYDYEVLSKLKYFIIKTSWKLFLCIWFEGIIFVHYTALKDYIFIRFLHTLWSEVAASVLFDTFLFF